ncbi:ABC transporter permease [Niallia sp. Krafla_26]|uniref:ABC transporter permease n=1 Tax=Niallia sp. Krafla_26 TaxID=3064703 RepID=UPI003D164F9B
MRKFFYAKLALTNIHKNRKTYYPYILTCIGTVVMYYILHFISVNNGLDQMSGGTSMKNMLGLGTYVIAIFSVIFLFYTNSFLIKRRKKEFGLFNILGMEKKHIARIMIWETLFVSIISFVVGLVTGILGSKLMFLLLLNMVKFEVPFGFYISWESIRATILLFVFIFILTLLNNMRQIHLSKPIELIKGGQTGEKEPKTKWVLTIIGVVALASGYYIALTTETPLDALEIFFIAVVLVIIGTYSLFTAGTITMLKMLRKNKNFYYKTSYFINISGMIYRMKQNAVGLASICILSTAVLVMLSTTIALYIGVEDQLRTRFPRDISVSAQNVSEDESKKMNEMIAEEAEKHNLRIENSIHYRYTAFPVIQNGNTFSKRSTDNVSMNEVSILTLIPLNEYNRMEKKSVVLDKNEVLLYTYQGESIQDTLSISGQEFRIKDRLETFFIEGIASNVVVNTYSLVVPDMRTIEEINDLINEKPESLIDLSYYFGFDTNGMAEDEIELTHTIQNKIKEMDLDYSVESAEESRESFYSLYGGLFFLGIFLGALFIMATVLIIYYKQISEGFDDRHRFEIMQKVGLSKAEVKKAIRSQVLMVFYLPLVTAIIHIAFAFPVITDLLALFSLTDTTLFVLTTCGTILVFAVFYAIIYSLTAKEYYRIVS